MRLRALLPRGWPQTQRFLTAPVVAGMSVVLCAAVAAMQGIAIYPSQHIFGILCASAAGGALAASMLGAGPKIPSAVLISLGCTLSTAYLLKKVARAAIAVGNTSAGAVIEQWLWVVVPAVFAGCFAIAYGGFSLRDRLQQLGRGPASGSRPPGS